MTENQSLVFIATCLGFGFLPGPAVLQTVSLTLEHGRRAGLISALGIHLGALVQICIVALGAAVVLNTSPWLYHGWRIACGAYLIWLGLRRLRAVAEAGLGDDGRSTRKFFLLSSMLVELLNPKSALFYLSFLMQFVDPSSTLGIGWQLVLLGALANALFSLANLGWIVFAHPLGKRMAPAGKIAKIGTWLCSGAFVALGVAAIIEP